MMENENDILNENIIECFLNWCFALTAQLLKEWAGLIL